MARGRRDLQVALSAMGAASARHLESQQQGGAPDSGSARPGALRGDVPPQVELEVVYLASGQALRLERPAALVAEAEKQGAEVAEGVKAGRFDARPERRRCRLCPYRLACAEAL